MYNKNNESKLIYYVTEVIKELQSNFIEHVDKFLHLKTNRELKAYFPLRMQLPKDNSGVYFFETIDDSYLNFENIDNYQIDESYLIKCISYLDIHYYNDKHNMHLLHVINLRNKQWTSILFIPNDFFRIYIFDDDYKNNAVSINWRLSEEIYAKVMVRYYIDLIKEYNFN